MQRSHSIAEAFGVLIGGALVIGAIFWWKHDGTPAPAQPDAMADRASALRIFETDLQRYGKAIPQRMQEGTLRYEHTKQTLSTPIVSYLITYTTSAPELMANAHGDTDPKEFAANTGVRMVWETKFCTDELKKTMQQAPVNVVIGNIEDENGKLQFSASCFKD